MSRLPEKEIVRLLSTMTKAMKMNMMKDVVQNLVERNDPEEMARFLNAQCGGDDLTIVQSYANGRRTWR